MCGHSHVGTLLMWGHSYVGTLLCGDTPMWGHPYVGTPPMWGHSYLGTPLCGDTPMWGHSYVGTLLCGAEVSVCGTVKPMTLYIRDTQDISLHDSCPLIAGEFPC